MILDRIFAIVSHSNNVYKIFDSFQQGTVVLQPGTTVLEIETRKEPVEVWVSIKDDGDMPVCNGDVNKVGVTRTYNGFILYADVASEMLQVDWHAVFELEDC